MARKSRSLPKFQITSPALPGCIFFSAEALDDTVDHAMAERAAFDEFDADGCEDALQFALQDLGWTYGAIRDYLDAPVNVRRDMVKIGYGYEVALAA